MAPKRRLEKPPPVNSSSSEETSDSSDEEQQQLNRNGVAQRDNANFPELIPKPGSESDSDSDACSDSDSSSESDSLNTNTTPSVSAFTIKPAAESKRKARSPTPPAPAKASDEEDEKKKKRKVSASSSNGGGAEDPKSPGGSSMFQRLWSEDDELAILKGMCDFKAEKGSDPTADMAGFHEFIRESLQCEASKAQLVDKVRRLKKKFLTNAGKDETTLAAKPHDLRSFELSKKVWGAGGATPAKPTTSRSKKVAVNDVADGEDFLGKFPWLSGSLSLASRHMGSEDLARKMNEALPMLESSKAKEMDKKWKKMGTKEIELQIQKLELALETYKLVLDSVKSSKH